MRLRDLQFKLVRSTLVGTLDECFAEGSKFADEFVGLFNHYDIECNTSYVKRVSSITSHFFTIPGRTDFLYISYYEGSDNHV
jgi:hypothetical protein